MEVTVEEVRDLFPELKYVRNKEWVQKACEIWKTVLARCKWKNPMDAQFGISAPGISLINHTRATTINSINLAKNLKELHGLDVPIDMDVIIIACVLHDVSKLIEMEPGENGTLCQGSEIGRTYQHAFFSAYYAEQAGLPGSIVTILTNHTAMSRVMPTTIEGMIVFYGDQADADITKSTFGHVSTVLKALGKIPNK